jgi:alpha-L-fucosidase
LGGPFKPGDCGVSTRKGNTVYLHVLKWPESGKLRLPAICAQLVKASLMAGGKAEATQSGAGLEISVVPEIREPVVTTVALEFDREVLDLAVAGP